VVVTSCGRWLPAVKVLNILFCLMALRTLSDGSVKISIVVCLVIRVCSLVGGYQR
jgi:hypothetical protein